MVQFHPFALKGEANGQDDVFGGRALARLPHIPAVQKATSVTRVGSRSHGELNLNVRKGGIPALRLLQWHAPEFRVECTNDIGATVILPLGDIDLKHESLDRLSQPPATPRAAVP